MKHILIILLSLFAATVSAETKVHLVIIKSPDAISRPQANTLMADTLSRFKKAKRPIRFYKVTEIEDVAPTLRALSHQYGRYNAYKQLAKKKKWYKKGVTVHFLTTPMIEGSTEYMGGLASFCTVHRGQAISVSHGNESNQLGESRLLHSSIAMAHEIAHTMCSTHDDSDANIMHSAAMAMVFQGMKFNSLARWEMVK
jgi:hypothetical protein